MFVHTPKKWSFSNIFRKIRFISVKIFLQFESKKKYLSFYLFVISRAIFFLIECNERTWWTIFWFFCELFFVSKQNPCRTMIKLKAHQIQHWVDDERKPKNSFTKIWKKEIILLNILLGWCPIIHKTSAMWINSSSSLKCSIFSALTRQNLKFAIYTKLSFYLIFSNFSDGTFRSLIIWFL